MVSPREMELLAETRLEEWRLRARLAEHTARFQKELALLTARPARPARKAVAAWLRRRLAASSAQIGSGGPALTKPDA